jgi:hypothetical protein
MTSLRERLNGARSALFSGAGNAQNAPIVVDADTPDEGSQDEGGDTGPLRVVRPIRPNTGQGGAAVSHFERQRKQIDSFDEDYADRWDKAKLFAAKIVALTLPIVAVLAIGDELGKYFAQFTGGGFSSVLIAYAGEAALAALTYILGSIFGRSEKSASHYIKLALTFVVWLLFILASAWGQWAVAATALPAHPATGLVIAVWLRIGMACMLDAASVAIMFWRGKSLTKYLNQLAQKATATIQVNEAELAIQRAQASAAARQREDDLYLAGKEQDQATLFRYREMQNQKIIKEVEGSLEQLPNDGGNRRGRQLRGGNGW